ncbi:hypothetical protein GOODEAATRI_018380, partial [Goodea atripinnis]
MGHPFSPVLCSTVVRRTFISCRIMYTITCLGRDQSLVRMPLCPNSGGLSTFTRSAKLYTSSASSIFIKEIAKVARHLHFFSFTNKIFKPETPVGIFDVPALKTHPGQSFNPLSRYLYIYLRRRNFVTFAENASLIITAPEYQCQSQRHRFSQWSATDQNKLGGSGVAQSLKCKSKQEKSDTISSSNEKSGLQLFHISSLTTKFGESYSYVAKHINSVFSQGYTVPKQDTFQGLSSVTGANRRVRRQKIPNSNETSEVKLNEEQITVEHNVSNNWEKAHPHFSRHINKYFGIKAADEAHNNREFSAEKKNSNMKHDSTKSNLETETGTTSQLNQKESTAREMAKLSHTSSIASNLGDNHFLTSSHINQYFGLQNGLNDYNRNVVTKMDPTSAKTTSLKDILHQPTSVIPGLLRAFLNLGPVIQTTAVTSPEAIINNR